jgi:hypothetical protein
MSQVHAIAAWSTTRIKEKWFPLLVAIKDSIKLSIYTVNTIKGITTDRTYEKKTFLYE